MDYGEMSNEGLIEAINTAYISASIGAWMSHDLDLMRFLRDDCSSVDFLLMEHLQRLKPEDGYTTQNVIDFLRWCKDQDLIER